MKTNDKTISIIELALKAMLIITEHCLYIKKENKIKQRLALKQEMNIC